MTKSHPSGGKWTGIVEPTSRAAAPSPWRAVKPSATMQKAMDEFLNLCFCPPDDPKAKHSGDSACGHSTAGEAWVMLRALYDKDKMQLRQHCGDYSGTCAVAKHALALLHHMSAETYKSPEKYLYKPLRSDAPPARESHASLANVLYAMMQELQQDFAPEFEALRNQRDKPETRARIYNPGNR